MVTHQPGSAPARLMKSFFCIRAGLWSVRVLNF
jgi:hypothetical protein